MSTFSINTNVGAQVALHSLASIQTGLARVQSQVSTGYKVASAQDNAAVFAVAQGIRTSLASNDANLTALAGSQSLVDVSLKGLTAASDLVTRMTTTLTRLADGSISDGQRRTYTAELRGQVDSIRTTLTSATYNGVNLISAYSPVAGDPLAISYGSHYSMVEPKDVTVAAEGNQAAVTIHAQNVLGTSQIGNGVVPTGWYSLARLVYFTVADDFIDPGDDEFSLDHGIGANDTNLISRSSLSPQAALAALSPISLSAGAYFARTAAGVTYSGTYLNNGFTLTYSGYDQFTTPATVGTASIFNSAIAAFSRELNTALSSFGADYSNVQSQISFVQSLNDAAKVTLGNLVDADMAQSAAQLTALQTRQQLATQALGIANAMPSNILKLFESRAA